MKEKKADLEPHPMGYTIINVYDHVFLFSIHFAYVPLSVLFATHTGCLKQNWGWVWGFLH